MKKLKWIYLFLFCIFLIVLTFSNFFIKREEEKTSGERNILINKIAADFIDNYSDNCDADEIVGAIFSRNKNVWEKQYGKISVPKEVSFFSVTEVSENFDTIQKNSWEQRIWPVYKDNEMKGLLVCSYNEQKFQIVSLIMNCSIVACFAITFLFLLYINVKVLNPFEKLSDYPEKLSKGEITEKIPETKEKLFGRLVWGVNMLSDKIINDKKQINRLMKEKQVMMSTVAHGIKTPVINIKLYASAIETGLYQPDGKPNEKDSEIARKIDKNADEITALVKKMMETTSTGMVDFEPEINSFYVGEIVDFINDEYGNRLNVHRIPYEIECTAFAMIKSDKSGLTRILSQILENAIKYGDGKGVFIGIDKQDEGFYFTVRNKGPLVLVEEIPYLFNSFWRGSNSENVEGNGIGLFEAKTIALRLGGDILAKRIEETGEMEFVMFLPINFEER